MKTTAVIAIGLTVLALSACAPRYYGDRYDDRYAGPRDRVEYVDRDRTNDPNTRDGNQVRDHYRDYRDHY